FLFFCGFLFFFFFSSRRRHTRFSRDWSSDVCSSDLAPSWRAGSAALACLLTPDELLDGAGQRRLEVDELGPGRRDDDAHHPVVERPDAGLPLGPLLGGHPVGAARLEVLLGDAVDLVELGVAAGEADR